jgi:hypothetical protein
LRARSLAPQIVRDPLALDDSFAALPERLKAHWAASAPHATLTDLLAGALLRCCDAAQRST